MNVKRKSKQARPFDSQAFSFRVPFIISAVNNYSTDHTTYLLPTYIGNIILAALLVHTSVTLCPDLIELLFPNPYFKRPSLIPF